MKKLFNNLRLAVGEWLVIVGVLMMPNERKETYVWVTATSSAVNLLKKMREKNKNAAG